MSSLRICVAWIICLVLFASTIIAMSVVDKTSRKHFIEQNCRVTETTRESVMFIAMPDGNGGTFMLPSYYTESLVVCDDREYWRTSK